MINLCLALALAAMLSETGNLVAPEIEAASAIVIDARSGHEWFAKNALDPRPVASTQKLLTALLVSERASEEMTIRVEAEDTQVEPSILGLKTGEIYPVRNLLLAFMVKSGNDAAITLARAIGGRTSDFIQLMNQRMSRLGGINSQFINPNGLPSDAQYSTARDMARMARVAYFRPDLREIMSTQRMIFRRGDGKEVPFVNTNRLLGKMPGVNGMKTGFTNASGWCLISSAALADREVICVILGSTLSGVWEDSRRLLEWALQQP